MKKVFKYRIGIDYDVAFSAPSDFELLHIGEQDGDLTAWGTVEVDNLGAAVHGGKDMRLCIRGTGHFFQGDEGKYIKTVQMPNGLVWHIFWRL